MIVKNIKENKIEQIENNIVNIIDNFIKIDKDFDVSSKSTDIRFNNDDEIDNDNNQCNICGDMFKEDLGLKLHVEDIHKDYFSDKEKSLLVIY